MNGAGSAALKMPLGDADTRSKCNAAFADRKLLETCLLLDAFPGGAATTLCALHYMACSVSIWITQSMGYVKRVALPTQGALLTYDPSLSSSVAAKPFTGY